MYLLALGVFVLIVAYFVVCVVRVHMYNQWRKSQPFCPKKDRLTLLHEVKDHNRKMEAQQRFLRR